MRDSAVPRAGTPRMSATACPSFWRCAFGTPRRPAVAASWVVGVIGVLLVARPAEAQTLTLQTASTGVAVSGTNPNWMAGIGNVNGLGVGSPAAGVSVMTSGVAGGVLYTTPYTLVIAGQASNVRAYVSSNFSNPSAVELRSCYPASGCATAGGYTVLSTNAASPTTVIGGAPSGGGTFTGSLAVFVRTGNGAGLTAASSSATVTFLTYRGGGGSNLQDTDTLGVSVTLQTAVRLLLQSAGGAAVTPASNYTLSFGSVNGLGIGPGAGLSVLPVSGGVIYRTPYGITASFSGFSATTASIKAHVNIDFTNPSALAVRRSGDNLTFSALSKQAALPTSITNSATTGALVTDYLGLFVATVNGSGAVTGPDNAVVTFTLVVP